VGIALITHYVLFTERQQLHIHKSVTLFLVFYPLSIKSLIDGLLKKFEHHLQKCVTLIESEKKLKKYKKVPFTS